MPKKTRKQYTADFKAKVGKRGAQRRKAGQGDRKSRPAFVFRPATPSR